MTSFCRSISASMVAASLFRTSSCRKWSTIGAAFCHFSSSWRSCSCRLRNLACHSPNSPRVMRRAARILSKSSSDAVAPSDSSIFLYSSCVMPTRAAICFLFICFLFLTYIKAVISKIFMFSPLVFIVPCGGVVRHMVQ